VNCGHHESALSAEPGVPFHRYYGGRDSACIDLESSPGLRYVRYLMPLESFYHRQTSHRIPDIRRFKRDDLQNDRSRGGKGEPQVYFRKNNPEEAN
jgi:hypothetical protein